MRSWTPTSPSIPLSLVQAECAIASGIVFLAVRANSAAHVDLPAVVRELVEETGYDDPDFNPRNVTVLSAATPSVAARQFEDNVSRPAVETVSATVFGYACRHTPEMLPLSIVLAHRLAQRLRDVRMRDEIPMLHPDGQVQVGVRYRGRMPECIESITLFSALSSQARADDQLSAKLHELVLRPVLEQIETPLSPDAQIVINPQNSVSIGGPARHAGLTGRKNDIDTYGGYSRHGGAALSGKDPSRIDRTGAYLARYAAKNVVAAGLAQECEVQISYAIGRFEPVSVEIDTFDSSTVPEAEILRALRGVDRLQRRLDRAHISLGRLAQGEPGPLFRAACRIRPLRAPGTRSPLGGDRQGGCVERAAALGGVVPQATPLPPGGTSVFVDWAIRLSPYHSAVAAGGMT